MKSEPDKTAFERAVVHLLISKGSVALPPENRYSWERRPFSTGSYYGSYIEADAAATLRFANRLISGARPIYTKCGPTDFGQESRFNGTFTDTQLHVHYACAPVYLDDDPDTPVILIAQISEDYSTSSFITTLKLLLSINIDDIDEAIEILLNRIAEHEAYQQKYGSWGTPLAHPEF